MLTRRQNLLAVVAGAALTPVPGWRGTARAADDGLTHMERSFGSPDAKTTCVEFFSLTCTHCAAFAAGTMPDVKKNLIETGKLRWVFHDYLLDSASAAGSQIARYLPVDRYVSPSSTPFSRPRIVGLSRETPTIRRRSGRPPVWRA